jgi:hypothetical protein
MFDPVQPADQSGAQPTEIKFKVGDREYDASAAAQKITHADQHISTLEQELATLRNQLALTEAQKTAREALAAQQPPAPIAQPTAANALDQTAQLEALAEERAFKALTRWQQEALAKANLDASTEAAKAVHGESYQQKLEQAGKELGMSKDDIVQMAQTKPEAFKRLFSLAPTAPKTSPLPTSSYSAHHVPTGDPIKDVAKLIVSRGASSRDRTQAIAQLLNAAKQ